MLYLPIWQGNQNPPELAQRKESLVDFARRFKDAESAGKAILQERTDRFDRALTAFGKIRGRIVRRVDFRLLWRFATGLGSAHPSGNGFAFDPSSGVPLLSGTAIKGLCRQAARLDGMEEKDIEALFGPERITTGEGFQGNVVFSDACLRDWPRLGVDIVNCHHQEYYKSLRKENGREERDHVTTGDL